jgi:hypothetical protein
MSAVKHACIAALLALPASLAACSLIFPVTERADVSSPDGEASPDGQKDSSASFDGSSDGGKSDGPASDGSQQDSSHDSGPGFCMLQGLDAMLQFCDDFDTDAADASFLPPWGSVVTSAGCPSGVALERDPTMMPPSLPFALLASAPSVPAGQSDFFKYLTVPFASSANTMVHLAFDLKVTEAQSSEADIASIAFGTGDDAYVDVTLGTDSVTLNAKSPDTMMLVTEPIVFGSTWHTVSVDLMLNSLELGATLTLDGTAMSGEDPSSVNFTPPLAPTLSLGLTYVNVPSGGLTSGWNVRFDNVVFEFE